MSHFFSCRILGTQQAVNSFLISNGGAIEAAVAPLGATVTSPDRLPDQTTGKLREVDATIRYKIGTSDVLIVVECRKRSRTQDITWIEQLTTKGRSIRANKLIAVSETILAIEINFDIY